MSHELRTPLNAVLGFAQLMETATPLPTPAQKVAIEQILRGGWYLLRLINEILDLALIESGKLMMVQETVDLSDVLLDCQVMILPQAKARNIAIKFPDDESKFYVGADQTRIKQVMINLLSNAIKYNRHEGSITVDCTITPEELLRIHVTDTGEGLTPELIGQLFQPFNRLGQEAGITEGTGIGLVVTKQLVELMGGTIGVHSEVGVGSTFWFELPIVDAPLSDNVSTASEASSLRDVSKNTQRTLLYVEDNHANLSLVEQLIERRSDLKLLTANDGLSGLRAAREQLPDLILMDINLPIMSGLEAMRLLKSSPETSHIPIIALTANAIPKDIEIGLSAGFFRYLTKPIRIDEFMNALDVTLDKISEREQKERGL
jgi:CheY-like chemotaxis protein